MQLYHTLSQPTDEQLELTAIKQESCLRERSLSDVQPNINIMFTTSQHSNLSEIDNPVEFVTHRAESPKKWLSG